MQNLRAWSPGSSYGDDVFTGMLSRRRVSKMKVDLLVFSGVD
ncbi:MAG: hypothetical protein PUG74_00760 [Prevotellaceae bacterium]|nr:hypothetical protein [Prevotellaceae bacterium]